MAPAVAHSQAESLLAFRLLLVGGMFSASTPPPGPLEKVFQYIDLHQDEFVQVRDQTCIKHIDSALWEAGRICWEMWIFFSFFLTTCCSVTRSCPILCDPMTCIACQASLSSTISGSLLKFMPFESLMLSNRLILFLTT